jgi:hypothetical protein
MAAHDKAGSGRAWRFRVRKAAASCWRLPKQVIESKGYYPTICEKIVLIFTFGLMYKAKINSN